MKLRESFDFLTTHENGMIKNTRYSVRILSRFEVSKIRVTVAPNREKRSLNQNAYYHGVVLPLICEHTGYSPLEQDRLFENMFCPREVKKWRGREIVMVKHCKDLSVVEFVEYLDRVIHEAAELGIVVPPADPTKSTRRLDA